MESDHSCNKCNCRLAEIDPHAICKNCRQPNPQMFYCNDEQCPPCIEIKSCKPLEDIIHKYELKKMAKKFALGYRSLPKKNSALVSSRNHRDFSRQSYSQASESSNENSSTHLENDNENYSLLEKRLLDKLLSRLSESNLSETSPPRSCLDDDQTGSASPSKLMLSNMESIFTSLSEFGSSNFTEAERKYTSSLIAFFKNLNNDLFANNEMTLKDDSVDPIVRLSSKAGDILRTSTLLSSPSCATKLIEVSSDCDGDAWPRNLKISNVLNLNSEIIRLKAHPKVRQMQNFLFGQLQPSLPKNITSPNFSLPRIPHQLQLEFIFARGQLQRLLLMFSIIDHFISVTNVDLNTVHKTFLLILQKQVELIMINQSNFLGLLIQEIRKVLLKSVVCRVPDAILNLITGPIHATQFFGPYVIELQRIVDKHGPSFCIQHELKRVNIEAHKLPLEALNLGKKSPTQFLKDLDKFFSLSESKEEDKVLILKYLIPKSLLSQIEKFTTPIKCLTYEEFSDLFKRYGNNCSDFLSYRLSFSRRVQIAGESPKEYGAFLSNLIPSCSFGLLEREILRDKFIFGLCNEQLSAFLIQKPLWSFEDCLDWVVTQVDGSKYFINKEQSGKSNKRKQTRESHSEKKCLKDMSYHESLNVLCTDKNKHIDVSNFEFWKQIFPFEDAYSYQVVCPWTGRLLRE